MKGPKKEPSQWAVDVKYAGLLPTVVLGVGFLTYTFGGWFGNSVWIPWQTKFLGNEQAQENLIKATSVLLATAERKGAMLEDLIAQQKDQIALQKEIKEEMRVLRMEFREIHR